MLFKQDVALMGRNTWWITLRRGVLQTTTDASDRY